MYLIWGNFPWTDVSSVFPWISHNDDYGVTAKGPTRQSLSVFSYYNGFHGLPRSVSTSMAMWRFRLKPVCGTVGVMDNDGPLWLNGDWFITFDVAVAELTDVTTRGGLLLWSGVMVIISEPSGNEHGVDDSRFGVLESRSTSTLFPGGTILYAENVRLTGHSPVSTHSMMCCNLMTIACSCKNENNRSSVTVWKKQKYTS